MNNKQLIRYAHQLLNICENCDRVLRASRSVKGLERHCGSCNVYGDIRHAGFHLGGRKFENKYRKKVKQNERI